MTSPDGTIGDQDRRSRGTLRYPFAGTEPLGPSARLAGGPWLVCSPATSVAFGEPL